MAIFLVVFGVFQQVFEIPFVYKSIMTLHIIDILIFIVINDIKQKL